MFRKKQALFFFKRTGGGFGWGFGSLIFGILLDIFGISNIPTIFHIFTTIFHLLILNCFWSNDVVSFSTINENVEIER